MKIIDMLPELDADALKTVHINAMRLVSTGSKTQKEQAQTALPLIEAEQARRAEMAPPKAKSTRAKVAKTDTVKKKVRAVSRREPADASDE